MNDPLLWQLILQLFLILVQGFCSAATAAVFELNAAALRDDAEKGDRRAAKLLKLAESPECALSALQVFSLFAAQLGSAFAALHLAERLTRWLVDGRGVTALSAGALNALLAAAVTIVLGFVTLVLGVLVPRRIALQKSDRVARITGPVVLVLSAFLRPAVWLVNVAVAGVLRLFGMKNQARPDNATEEEIRMMLDESEEEGLIESTEGEMIDNVFEFNNIQICDVMTHRVDVESIDVESTPEEITERIRETGYSRFPVYEQDQDNIVGMLYVKDYFLNQDKPLREILKEPLFVPDSLICDDLFRRMQREHVHFAVVTDEYGSFLGVVTLEDLIEEIVGNIYDEYDEREEYITPNPDGSWNISGRAELKDVEKALDLELPEHEDFNTLSGLILSETEEIPRDGDQFTLDVDGLRIEVLRVEDRRIEETRVTVLGETDEKE